MRNISTDSPHTPPEAADPDASEGSFTPPSLDLPEREALRVILRRLPRNNRVRVLGEEILNQPSDLDENALSHLQLILLNQSSLRQNELEAAAFLCSCIPLTAPQRAYFRDALINLIELRNWRKATSQNFASAGVVGFHQMILAILFVVFLYRLLQSRGADGTSMTFLLALSVLAFASSLTVLEDVHLNRVKATALRSLARFGLPNSVTLLAEETYRAAGGGMSMGSQRVRQAAAQALPRVLARMNTEAHYGRLPAPTVPNLCRALSYADNTLTLDILNALEKIGDGRAVPAVKRLTTRGKTAAIRATALRILPILEQRQYDENAPRVLLRASEPVPAPAANVLLRPVSENAQERPDELLRATRER